MTSQVLNQPGAALWIYVFVVLILLVLMLIGKSVMPKHMDRSGTAAMKGGLAYLVIAIILGIAIYFLLASGIEQWAWFLALMPVAILLFGVYFALFGAMGKVMLLVGAIIALFVMIWLIYYAFVTGQWSLLAFPAIYIIMMIMGGVGFSSLSKKKSKKMMRREEEEDMSADVMNGLEESESY